MKIRFALAFVTCLSGCVSLPDFYDELSGLPISSEAEVKCRTEARSARNTGAAILPPRPKAAAEGGALLGNSLRTAFEFREAYEMCVAKLGYVRSE